MTNRKNRFAALAAVILLLAIGGAALAQTTTEQPPERAAYTGGYLKYTYRTTAGAFNVSELTTTEIAPQANGQYQVTTTTTETTPLAQVHLGFMGMSLNVLRLYQRENTSGRVDISPLDNLATLVLEPQKKYLLPDGGLFQTSERVTIAGLSGVKGVYTQADVPNVTVTIVLADDLTIRQLLPFPLSATMEYTQAAGTAVGEGMLPPGGRFSGTIELVEYKRSQ
jgi:hypothetical protein